MGNNLWGHFRVWYAAYYKRVYHSCLLILKNPALAEDATQDAFLKAYESIDTLKDPEKFGPWVAAIATKKAINIYNRNKRIYQIDGQLGSEYLFKDAFLDPSEEVVHREFRMKIREAIAKLKPPYDQLIILKYYWELCDNEIAEMLDMPVGTVKSSLFRARRMLLRALPSIDRVFLKVLKEGSR